jgi:hypothetical protein
MNFMKINVSTSPYSSTFVVIPGYLSIRPPPTSVVSGWYPFCGLSQFQQHKEKIVDERSKFPPAIFSFIFLSSFPLALSLLLLKFS